MEEQSKNNPRSHANGSGEKTSLDRLHFLLGKWRSNSKPGEPAGGFTFTSQLQSRIILRTNYADYPAAGRRPAFRHEDLMVIYCDESQALRADYYDSEGHVIRYSGQVTDLNRVVFISEPTAFDPVFRLSYQLDETSELNGLFEVAPPDQPADFSVYLSWAAHRENLPASNQEPDA